MSNVESLLTAILTRDAQYIVVPQSRVEELLLAIYNSGGGGGGGEGGVDEFARAELLKKVDKRDGYALISTSEIERLAGVSNYDDTAIKALIDKKVTAKNGFSLIDDTDYANFKNLKNYDDTAIKALINKKVDDTVTVAGLKITTNITAAQLATALELSTYVKKDGTKVLSTNDFTNDYKNQIDTNTTEIEKKVNKTSVSSGENSTTSVINVTDAKAQMAMVASIKGKTRKSKNLFSLRPNVTNSNVTVKTNADGSITVSGTKSVSTTIFILLGQLPWTDGVSYTVSAKGFDANNPLYIVSNEAPRNFTASGTQFNAAGSDGNNHNVFLRIDSATVNFTMYPMMCLSSESNPTVYEPYGELYSAPVESVVSEGSNHFSFDNMYDLRASVTAVGNGYYKILSTAAWSYTNTRVYNLKVNTKYKIFIDTSEKSAANLYVAVKRKDANTNYNTLTLNAGQVTSYEFTALETEAVISINPNNSATASTTAYVTVRVAIIESSLNPTGYVPYNKTTVLVPSEARNCVGYGLGISDSLCNIVDFENGVYTQMLKEIDLGDLTWNLDGSGTGRFYTNPITDIKATAQNAYTTDLCGKYSTSTYERIQAKTDDKAFAGADSVKRIWIRDTSYTDAAKLKSDLKGVKYVYELASHDTKPLTDYIRPLPVENGGTLTLVNEHNLDVNSTIKYKKEVN